MLQYEINRGIGQTVEFKGLKSQYLFMFAGGLLALFVVLVIMYMIGISTLFCVGFGCVAPSVLVWKIFDMNKRYGEHGLMKLSARRSHPKYLINRKIIHKLFTTV